MTKYEPGKHTRKTDSSIAVASAFDIDNGIDYSHALAMVRVEELDNKTENKSRFSVINKFTSEPCLRLIFPY